MVTYKYGELGFITWLDNKPNTDILEGSGKDVFLDNVASHRIVIKRDREPKMFNVLNIKLTVMGTGFVIYNLTGVNGQNEIKMVLLLFNLNVYVIIGFWLYDSIKSCWCSEPWCATFLKMVLHVSLYV